METCVDKKMLSKLVMFDPVSSISTSLEPDVVLNDIAGLAT